MAVGIIEFSAILYIVFSIVGLIILFDLISKAFNTDFLSGLLCMLFPIGTYIYFKRVWPEKRLHAIGITVCCAGAIVFKVINYSVVP